MRVMKVIWGTDRQIVEVVFIRAAAKFFKVPVESLELGKKGHIREIAIENPHGIVWINRSDQTVSCVADGFEVSGRDVAGRPSEGKSLHRHGSN